MCPEFFFPFPLGFFNQCIKFPCWFSGDLGNFVYDIILVLKYFVTSTCGIASLGSLKTIWILVKEVYNPFIILKLICALYLCLSLFLLYSVNLHMLSFEFLLN